MIDTTATFIVKKLLEGCRRTRPQRDVRAPITEAMLGKLCAVLPGICFSRYETILFKAAFLTAYFGLLRVSEVVFTNQFQAFKPLLRTDVQFEDESRALIISIRVSKTNQAGPPTRLRIPMSADPSLCCVAAVQQFLNYRPANGFYLFCHQNGRPLTSNQFSGVLSKAVRELGLSPQLYTSHSFRIGRASDLAAKGIPCETIMKLGRWRSGAVERYIRS